MRYRRIEQYPSDRALALDILLFQEASAHTGGWSIVFGDGHVAFNFSASVYDSIPPHYDGDPLWHSWGVFSQYLRDLEQY